MSILLPLYLHKNEQKKLFWPTLRRTKKKLEERPGGENRLACLALVWPGEWRNTHGAGDEDASRRPGHLDKMPAIDDTMPTGHWNCFEGGGHGNTVQREAVQWNNERRQLAMFPDSVIR